MGNDGMMTKDKLWLNKSSQQNTVAIIGNGFDICHGLPSRYSCFKEWLKEHNEPLLKILDEYVDVSGEWWNEFESSLSKFNVSKLIANAPKYYPPRNSSPLPEFSYPESDFFRSIREQISKSFTEWARSLNCSSAKPLLRLPAARLYVSFNYTDTLEQLYDVSEREILYIHGKAARGDDLVFGHVKSPFDLEGETILGNADSQLIEEISFLDKFPYTQIAKYKSTLLPALTSANYIWVFGLSFSEEDYEYIEWISMKNRRLSWIVSWHTELDKRRILATFDRAGVTDYELFYSISSF